MSDFKKMIDNFEKVKDIQAKGTGLLRELQIAISDDVKKVNDNPDLSPEGKHKKLSAIKKDFGEYFIKESRKMRDEHDKAVISARNRAQEVLNNGPKKPNDADIKTFDRNFKDLQMQLMLSNDANSSLKQIQTFMEQQSDPYFVHSVINEFSSLVNNILDAAGNDKAEYKVKLQKVYESAKERSKSDEQKEAERIYQATADDFGAPIFKQGLHTNKITELFGQEFSRYANKPHLYPLKGENEQGGAE